MHPVFAQYNSNAPRWVKTIFLNALALLLPSPAVRHEGPSTMLAMLNEQKEKKRNVLHLLHYIPERRGADFDVVEDVIPLYNIAVSVKPSMAVKKVLLVPQMKPVPFKQAGGRIEMTVPEIRGHQMIELS